MDNKKMVTVTDEAPLVSDDQSSASIRPTVTVCPVDWGNDWPHETWLNYEAKGERRDSRAEPDSERR